MSRIDTSRVRWLLVRDARGRDLFVPWHPYARTAYVVPDPRRRGALEQRVRRQTAVVLGVGVVGLAVARYVLGWGFWPGVGWIAAVLAYWYGGCFLLTRGLERTRYER